MLSPLWQEQLLPPRVDIQLKMPHSRVFFPLSALPNPLPYASTHSLSPG